MGFLRLILAIICVFAGIALTITIIGAIIGIPLFLIGLYLAYSEQRNRHKDAVRDGVKEAIKDMENKNT